jgi:hypothetical protein
MDSISENYLGAPISPMTLPMDKNIKLYFYTLNIQGASRRHSCGRRNPLGQADVMSPS